jgi:uncharacterized protein YbjT (DUF2867 family)
VAFPLQPAATPDHTVVWVPVNATCERVKGLLIAPAGNSVFVAGGTGYLGSRLIPLLVERGYEVRALVREGSLAKLPSGTIPVIGEALDRRTFESSVAPAKTFIQLIGTPSPLPARTRQFEAVDLVSIRESVAAARSAGVAHFIYVSVAQPAPVMRAFVAVRAQGEALVREEGLNATVLRPWYVLGPGHRWAHALQPLYWVAERIPSTRDTAHRLGLVTLQQMLAALVEAVTQPCRGTRIVTVPEIRTAPLRLRTTVLPAQP